MFKLRIGLFSYHHKLCIRSSASILKTQNLSSSCSTATCIPLLSNHLPRSSSPVVIPSRTFWETFPASGRSFHAKDELDKDNHELVYRNKLFNYAFYGQLISELVFLSQIGYVLYHSLNYFLIGKIVPTVCKLGPFTINYDLIAMGALSIFALQNACIFMAAQKGLLRIYHKKDTDEYVFVSLAVNPFKIRKVICKPGELKCLHVNSLMTFLKGNYEVTDRQYFIRRELFKTNYHYNKLVYNDY